MALFLFFLAMARGVGVPGITRLVGNTPLLRVRLFDREFPQVEVYAKAEWFNPGGSVKDRAALSMIEDGERRKALTRDRTIIDSTSGNTGIAYALIGSAKGYHVRLVMPGNVSAERKDLVTAYGAEIVYSDAGEGSDGAIRMVRDIVAANPDESPRALRGHRGGDPGADERPHHTLCGRARYHRNVRWHIAAAEGARRIHQDNCR